MGYITFTDTGSTHTLIKRLNFRLTQRPHLFFIACMFFCISSGIAIAQNVNIPDPGLRAALELALDKESGADITREELASLELLEIVEANIRDLTGLEYASNLLELRLGNNRIDDLSPIEGLINLNVLDLHLNRMIQDLTPLKNLTNLNWLSLTVNRITDVTPLKDLVNLSYLNLDDNYRISDVSPCKGLINLRYLSLDENQISDLSPLKDLTNLRFLALDDNLISDVSPLINLTNLRELDLNDNKNISDLTPLQNMTNLTFLEIHGNKISDVSPLINIINLRDLRLQENQISDVSPLSNMLNLTYLDLNDNKISDVSPLKNLTNLKYLDLRDNKILDFASIIGLITNLDEYYTDQLTMSVDVNRDGVVDLIDLLLVASNYGNPNFEDFTRFGTYPDVNSDGVVDVKDIIAVAAAIDAAAAAPALLKYPSAASNITVKNLKLWIQLAAQLEEQGYRVQKGINVMKHLLTVLHQTEMQPNVTSLLPNYPNPFNPETWIPYQLANPAEVNISIHSAGGKLVRLLQLGNLSAGLYHRQPRAAYWDGRNELGESVASGVYFYTFTADDFTGTGKMFIKK